MQNVMTQAWAIAREGQAKFGGSVREYFAEALRMAWRIAKNRMEKFRDVKKVVTSREWKNYGKHRIYIDASIQLIELKNVNGVVVDVRRRIEGKWYYDVIEKALYRIGYRERDMTRADKEVANFMRTEIKKMICERVREVVKQ